MKALVTGAGSGIGRAIAIQLAQDGYDIIAVGRREKPLRLLQEEMDSDVEVICADLSDRQECFRLYREVAGDPIEILVNNAGFGVFGPFSETDLGKELDMLDVNIDSVHILTKLFLSDFRSSNAGYILNVASSAGFLPGPLFSSYYASKAYVIRLTQAIHEELRREKSRVYIGALCPGPVDTEFNNRAGVAHSLPGMPVDEVAAYAVKKMYRHKTIIVPGATMKIVRFFSGLLPSALMARLAWYPQKQKLG